MPGKRGFEEQIAALDALRQAPEEVRIAGLRKALGNRNNFIAAKAADLVREFALTMLVADLLASFDRFFEDPVKADPQCWAKNALSRTLAAFEHQDEEVFLRGMRHIQMQPVWGDNPTRRELCGPRVRWPWCNAAVSPNGICSRTWSTFSPTKTSRFEPRWFARSSRWGRRRRCCYCG